MLEMEHTRVNRLLGTLAFLGFAEKTAQRKYRPGPGVHVLAAQSLKGSRLLTAALPVLKELRDPKLTVALGVLWQGQVCFLFHARPWHTFEEAIGRHALWPAEKSSAGVVLLAHRPSDENLEGIARGNGTLAINFQRIRKQGYTQMVFPNGQVSLGVPIGSPPIAALAVSSAEFAAKDIPVVVKKLKDAAAQIQERMESPATDEPVPDMAILAGLEEL
ncbi:MAG: hypothetical protein WCT04_24500, partial [Planctomycetota bacterium]